MTFAKGLPSLFLRAVKSIAPAVVFIVVVLVVTAPSARTTGDDWRGHHRRDRSWIGTWAVSPQAAGTIPIAVTGFTNQTLRQIVFNSLGGRTVRVRFTNEFSAISLNIGAAQVAIAAPDGSIEVGSGQPLTFGGQSSVTVVPNAYVVSDPVQLSVPEASRLAIDIYLPGSTGPVTWHRVGLRTTYVSSTGNYVGAPVLPVVSTVGSYFFLKGVEVQLAGNTGVVVALGDSITDGIGATPDTDNRYSDHLARLLAESHGRLRMSVLNQGIASNFLLANSINGGQSVQARFDRDVLSQPGVTHVIVLIGLNDLFFGSVADRVIAGHQQLILRARARGLKVYGGTLTPAGRTGTIEAGRQAVNDWIRTGGAYDAVIDFDAAMRDPDNPAFLLPAFNAGDNIHPNDVGYEAMAQTAYDVFRRERRER
jgi:lysophospholipase L1-like esterase